MMNLKYAIYFYPHSPTTTTTTFASVLPDLASLHLVLQTSLNLELDERLEGLVNRHQLTLGLGSLVVSVSDVDGARLGLLSTNHCINKLAIDPS